MASGHGSDINLEGWAAEDIEATFSQFAGIGATAGLPEQPRFVAGVAYLLRERKAFLDANCQSAVNDIAIFVLKPTPPDSTPSAVRVPMVNNGRTEVGGRLWFTAPTANSAHYVTLPYESNDDDARFTYVTDELNLGSLPTLIFDPRTVTPQLRWYPEGLKQLDNVELKPLAGDVSPDDVFEAIDLLYMRHFVTPDGLPHGVSLWHDASRHRPLRNAEALVQSHLMTGLTLRFPHCIVRHEQPETSGRNDLEIEQIDPNDHSVVTRHAVIELKVLRSYRYSGSSVSEPETRRWIKDGVIQAMAYRNEKNIQWSALCCFDMREDDEGDGVCFTHVRNIAAALDVILGRWFIYKSARDYRRALSNSP